MFALDSMSTHALQSRSFVRLHTHIVGGWKALDVFMILEKIRWKQICMPNRKAHLARFSGLLVLCSFISKVDGCIYYGTSNYIYLFMLHFRILAIVSVAIDLLTIFLPPLPPSLWPCCRWQPFPSALPFLPNAFLEYIREPIESTFVSTDTSQSR